MVFYVERRSSDVSKETALMKNSRPCGGAHTVTIPYRKVVLLADTRYCSRELFISATRTNIHN